MNLILRLLIAALLLACVSVRYQTLLWQRDNEELPIPPGKVRDIPFGPGRGICTQGDPSGLSVWYLIYPARTNWR